MINWLKCNNLAWILQFYPHFYQSQILITQTYFPQRLDSHFEEYYQKLVEALELDTQAYSHVNPEILRQFKASICKYPAAFHLPGAELHPVKSFHHDINTGNSPPVYRMPYQKKPPGTHSH